MILYRKTTPAIPLVPIVATSLCIVIGVALFVFSSLNLLTLFAVVLLSICLGFLLRKTERRIHNDPSSDHPLDLPFAIAHDQEIYQHYLEFSRSLKRISQIPDPVYRDAAIEKIKAMDASLRSVAVGTLTFDSSETWRLVYEALLRSPSVYLYRSVAWVRNENYWQDEPGRKSTRLNFELVDQQRLNIERIVIIADSLWPKEERFPTENILRWVDEHLRHGIWIKLVRESTIQNEPDLMVDMGIYGSHAVGEQILDEDCKTLSFVLKFDFATVEAAEQRWNRLSIYAVSYKELLAKPP
jgi:hypothetical protein